MKGYVGSFVVLILLGLIGCAPSAPPIPQSALATRTVQTREFEVNEPKLVMRAVVNALQDQGFTINNAVPDLGLVTATREVDSEDTTSAIFRSALLGRDATWQKATVIAATINVSDFGKQTRVRASFHQKVLDNRNSIVSVHDVTDLQFYQEFFAKVDKSIFLQKERV